jgi:hypothetical protein
MHVFRDCLGFLCAFYKYGLGLSSVILGCLLFRRKEVHLRGAMLIHTLQVTDLIASTVIMSFRAEEEINLSSAN